MMVNATYLRMRCDDPSCDSGGLYAGVPIACGVARGPGSGMDNSWCISDSNMDPRMPRLQIQHSFSHGIVKGPVPRYQDAFPYIGR
jgi:hypothetical protein